jgi:hypothetical protein
VAKELSVIDFRLTLRGTTTPLLMHSCTTADPLDNSEMMQRWREATKPRTKTLTQHWEIARLEHRLGLYYDPDMGPYIPVDNVHAMLIDAAKKLRLGVAMKTGVIFPPVVGFPLLYKGPRTPNELWEDKNFRHLASIKLNGNRRIMRCRPRFPTGWLLEVTGQLDSSTVNWSQFQSIVEIAGEMIGLGDWRPKFGRFDAELEKAA